MSAWFCEAHRIWTYTDCPKCDDESIRFAETAEPCLCGTDFTCMARHGGVA